MFENLGLGEGVLLVVCLAIALGFEFVNGFHDTANAVATVIYTSSLRPRLAVLLSGLCNFVGVFLGGIAVAMGIVKLLPVELLVQSGTGAGLAMVLSLLLAAIVWNLFTWWLGLPSSSSHTLIGAILGVGLASSLAAGHGVAGVNWHKAGEIGLSLLISPLLGFAAAAVAFLLLRRVASAKLFAPPVKDQAPPAGSARLVGTCSAVSFAHGSNDGQKGVGLVMLILIGLVPQTYALDARASRERIAATRSAALALDATIAASHAPRAKETVATARESLAAVSSHLGTHESLVTVPGPERFRVRQAILLADKAVADLLEIEGALDLDARKLTEIERRRAELRAITDYAPCWVMVAIAVALGVGTTVGWKRIVVTVGEKIGKAHLTYAQGAAAELVAASTIGLSALVGMPVSTTHVLSSGIAGTMVAQRSGLQGGTVKKIALAWVLTLPVSMLLAGGIFLALRAVLASGTVS